MYTGTIWNCFVVQRIHLPESRPAKIKKFKNMVYILKRTEKEEYVRKMYSRQRTFYCATDHATGMETGFSICDQILMVQEGHFIAIQLLFTVVSGVGCSVIAVEYFLKNMKNKIQYGTCIIFFAFPVNVNYSIYLFIPEL